MQRDSIITVSILIVCVIAVAIAAYVYMRPGETKENSAAMRVLSSSEESGQATFTTLAGEAVDINAHAGKIRIVNSWATWSPFSAADLTLLNTLAGEYPEQVVVIAVNRAEPEHKVRAFLAQFAIPTDGLTMVLNPEDTLYDTVGGYAMPETIIFDTTGAEFVHIRGELKEAEFRQRLQELLQSE